MGNFLTSPGMLLRLEGAALAILSIALYSLQGGDWLAFALLLLTPDASMLGYLAGANIGAAVYNLAHNLVLPSALAALGLWGSQPTAMLLALIWLAHIGIDRVLGFGLKYPTEFKDSHFGRV
ncbi:MAG TPA: DUF4260 domain-containing protein [Anaerolineae bacterium]|nr:DUF4260 domain-containing protein [Anaerolineae bacterium]